MEEVVGKFNWKSDFRVNRLPSKSDWKVRYFYLTISKSSIVEIHTKSHYLRISLKMRTLLVLVIFRPKNYQVYCLKSPIFNTVDERLLHFRTRKTGEKRRRGGSRSSYLSVKYMSPVTNEVIYCYQKSLTDE